MGRALAHRQGGIREGIEAPGPAATCPVAVELSSVSWVAVHTSAIVTSLGLIFDIGGAWLVASEIVRQYHGRKYSGGETWPTISEVTETESFRLYEMTKYRRMKWGLGLLTCGFALQLIGTWLH